MLLAVGNNIIVDAVYLSTVAITYGITNFHMLQQMPVNGRTKADAAQRLIVAISTAIMIGLPWLLFLYFSRFNKRTNFFKFYWGLKDPGYRYLDNDKLVYNNPLIIEMILDTLHKEDYVKLPIPEYIVDSPVVIYDLSQDQAHICIADCEIRSDIRDWIVDEQIAIDKYTGQIVNESDVFYYDMKWKL